MNTTMEYLAEMVKRMMKEDGVLKVTVTAEFDGNPERPNVMISGVNLEMGP